jgi:diguanylate cyclase (GGDEF)-like protein
VAFACGMIALLYAWQTVAAWRAVERAAEREAINLAGSLSEQTASSFDTTDAVLQRMYFWANKRGVEPPKRPLLRDLLSVRTPSMAGIGELAFFDAAGERVVRSGPPLSAEVLSSERRALAWHAAHASLDPFVVAPVSGADSASVITISRRFNDERGRFAGMVLAAIRIAVLRPLTDAVDVGRTGSVNLTLTDGTLVLHKPFSYALVGAVNQNPQVILRARTATSGIITLRSTIDGEERLFAFHRVKRFPLLDIVGLGVAERFAEWRDSSILGLVGVSGILLTIVLLMRRLLAELRRNARTQAQLSHYAWTDGLTGLSNRRQLDASVARECAASKRDGSTLSLMMIDVDLFKRFNDRYGHQRGDEALKQVAACLRLHCTRPRDVVARYGGEEFAVLLPSTATTGAQVLAEKIRRSVADSQLAHADSPYGVVTVSIGIAETGPGTHHTPAELIRLADALLYEAKEAGRNRTFAATEAPMLFPTALN